MLFPLPLYSICQFFKPYYSFYYLAEKYLYGVICMSMSHGGPTTADKQLLAEVSPASSIAEVKRQIEELNQSVKGLEAVFQQIKAFNYVGELIGRWKAMTCKMNSNGVCIGWRIPSDIVADVKKNLGDNAVIEKDGTARFNVANTALVCMICPIYISRS